MLESTDSQRVVDGSEVHVPAVRLSHFIESSVDLLKIDVEGAEWKIIDDLISSGKIHLIRNMIIEYHHQINKRAPRLSQFLEILEAQGFGYQLDTRHHPILRPDFQDILIGAYRRA